MNKRKTGFMALAVAVLLVGCATGFKATHDHDPANDFTAYKTFTWISEHPMTVGATDRIVSPLLESRIMVTVESALGTKGYSLVPDVESADFALAFTVGSREEIKVDSYPSMTAGHMGYGYPRHWGGWGGSKCIMDFEKKVSMGYAMNKMGPGIESDVRAARIAKALKKILQSEL